MRGLIFVTAFVFLMPHADADDLRTKDSDIRKTVFASYDKMILPIQLTNNTVSANVAFFILAVNYDMNMNILKIQSHTAWEWEDTSIEWHPENYGELSEILLSSNDLWIPDATFLNGGGFQIEGEGQVLCRVASMNVVRCEYHASYRTMCTSSYETWVEDSLICALPIHSWTYTLKELDIRMMAHPIGALRELRSNEWEVTSKSIYRKLFNVFNETYPGVELVLKLHRSNSGLLNTVIIPALVLAILNLATFFLDPCSSERLVLCSVNVLAHCLFLQYLGYRLPTNGDTPPQIVLFFCYSLFLVGVGLVLSVLQRIVLKESCFQPPEWLSSGMGELQGWKVAWILGLPQKNPEGTSEEVVLENGDVKLQRTWLFVAALANRVFFYFFCVVLCILLMTKVF